MPHAPRILRALPLALLALALASCASSSWRFGFDPSPAESIVQPEAGGPVVARVLTSVIEGRRAGGRGEPEMHMRLLLENRDTGPVRLLAEGMKLVGSNVQAFGSPRVEPALGEDVPPGQSRTYEIFFAYPSGMSLSAPELDGLNLSWSIGYDGHIADITQSFARRPYPRGYYYDEPNVRWSFFFVGHSHH